MRIQPLASENFQKTTLPHHLLRDETSYILVLSIVGIPTLNLTMWDLGLFLVAQSILSKPGGAKPRLLGVGQKHFEIGAATMISFQKVAKKTWVFGSLQQKKGPPEFSGLVRILRKPWDSESFQHFFAFPVKCLSPGSFTFTEFRLKRRMSTPVPSGFYYIHKFLVYFTLQKKRSTTEWCCRFAPFFSSARFWAIICTEDIRDTYPHAYKMFFWLHFLT